MSEKLSWIASCAAVEIDNLILKRSAELDAVSELVAFLEDKMKGKEMRQTLALLVWQTMSEEDKERTRTVSKAIAHVEEMIQRLRRVFSINPVALDELSCLRDFCISMSKQAQRYDLQFFGRYW